MKKLEIEIKGETTQDLIEALGMAMDEIASEHETGSGNLQDGEGEYSFAVYE